MSTLQQQVVSILDQVLSLNGRSAGFSAQTRLLGAIPELDSMAVVGVITALEERLGIQVADDEIDAATFATVGSLSSFVQDKVSALRGCGPEPAGGSSADGGGLRR